MNSNKAQKQRRFINILICLLLLSLITLSKSQSDIPDESEQVVC
jgi:hypothetical protein